MRFKAEGLPLTEGVEMRKDIDATVLTMQKAIIELTAAIDTLRIELEALKMSMERYHPGMLKSHPKLREEARARNRKTRANGTVHAV
jgi:hypothetical protein